VIALGAEEKKPIGAVAPEQDSHEGEGKKRKSERIKGDYG